MADDRLHRSVSGSLPCKGRGIQPGGFSPREGDDFFSYRALKGCSPHVLRPFRAVGREEVARILGFTPQALCLRPFRAKSHQSRALTEENSTGSTRGEERQKHTFVERQGEERRTGYSRNLDPHNISCSSLFSVSFHQKRKT